MERGENACRCFFFFFSWQSEELMLTVTSEAAPAVRITSGMLWFFSLRYAKLPVDRGKRISSDWRWRRKKERKKLTKQTAKLLKHTSLTETKMISAFSFFLSGGRSSRKGRRLAPQRRRGRQKSRRERTSASTTGSGKWDQSNERQMPPISNTWTRMIPLVHVDCCAALMAQHLQFNRGSSETIWMLIILSLPLWCLWFTLR